MPSLRSEPKLAALFALFLPIGAVAASPPMDFSPVEIAIAQARRLSAEDYAPVELARAEQRLADSRKALAARKKSDAALLAEQAEMEALVAQARSRAAAGRAQVNRKSAENAKLRHDLLGEGSKP